jgi:hypothetical protein
MLQTSVNPMDQPEVHQVDVTLMVDQELMVKEEDMEVTGQMQEAIQQTQDQVVHQEEQSQDRTIA